MPTSHYAIICRHGIASDDLVVFMDGDTIIEPGLIAKCAPLFAMRPNLGAVTTDEVATVAGPGWMQDWYALRFAQRRLVMESHSLSRRVLTLTGRLSIFRGEIAQDEEFIRTIETDSLDHWLWGRFRFLSGDDKSTWYWVLKSGYEMLYVPDALCRTVENIGINPYERLVQNLLRWSGNMLRNGARAIALGPRRIPFFIWWCLIDQRLAMWTMLTGPTAALLFSFRWGPDTILAYFIWVIVTRLLLSCVLFFYAGEIFLSFPFLLYLNQLVTSGVKVHLLFRLSKQRWLNRGDQRSPAAARLGFSLRDLMANFLTIFYISLLILGIAIYTGAAELPRFRTAWEWLSH